MNHKRATIGTTALAVLTLSLLALVLLAPIAKAPAPIGRNNQIPTDLTVGGEIESVNILQLLAPYLLVLTVAVLGAVAVLCLVVYSRRRKS